MLEPETEDVLRRLGRKDNSEAIEVTLEDFYAYMPMHNYIFAPTRDLWPATSVNARIPPIEQPNGRPTSASAWLDKNRPVEQMTWCPGLPMLIKDRLVSHGGWIEREGVHCFNLYRPPLVKGGDAAKADLWLRHVKKIYPHDADHIIKWCAHRVQRPQVKINHALVLGGKQGIGKDTLLEPLKYAVGAWNFIEVSPQQMTASRFNGYRQSVVLRINEGRDLGDVNRYQFYEHLKPLTATPPDVLRVDEKNLREYSVFNCCGVIITTNYKADGIHLPDDDRRHYVAWSDLTKDDFDKDYWKKIWSCYANGGVRHVAAYLAQFDISGFDAKAPPPKTEAWFDIVNASRPAEDAELADVLELLGDPDATTVKKVIAKAAAEGRVGFKDWLSDRKNRRVIPHRFEACEYVPVRNPDRKTGIWVIDKERQVVYAKQTLPLREQINAARGLSGENNKQQSKHKEKPYRFAEGDFSNQLDVVCAYCGEGSDSGKGPVYRIRANKPEAEPEPIHGCCADLYFADDVK